MTQASGGTVKGLVTVCAGLLVAIVMVVGCGSGGTSSSSSAGADGSGEVTKAAFIEEADAICAAANEEFASLEREAESIGEGGPRAEVEVAELLNEGVDLSLHEMEELRDLPTPAGDDSIIDSMLGNVEKADALDGEVAEALEEGERSNATELRGEAQALSDRAKGMAEGYGLSVCGSEDE